MLYATAMTFIAVPIAAKDFDTARGQIRSALEAGAEMLELRTDYLANLSPHLAVKLLREAKSARPRPSLPVIVTCRDKDQGGSIKYDRELRTEVLVASLRAGADFIDIEYDNFLSAGIRERILQALAENQSARLIISAHNFAGPFDDIAQLYRDILWRQERAIPKLVYTANHINDCFQAFDLLYNTKGQRIIFCMGRAGLISRIIAKKLGSFLTFASIEAASATAPGQLTIGQIKNLYRYDNITAGTELYGVIAAPVEHSLSPAVHNGCFAAAGLNKLYLPLLVEGGQAEFERFLDNVIARPWLDFRGFSVTVPHKQNALVYVKQKGGFVEPLAERIGAVNTVVIETQGRLSAYNTDYTGALNAITSALGITRSELRALHVAVVGAGGVARAIVAGLKDAGAKVTIYNRTVEKAQKLAEDFGCEYAGLDKLSDLDAALLVNCTSVGMSPNVDASPVPREALSGDMVVFDTVYNPFQTRLLREARQAGARTVDGVSMFVNQAAEQFKLFTGLDADGNLIKHIVHTSLQNHRL